MDKAYDDGFEKLTLTNDERIKELEMKRDQHLRWLRNEIYEELARREVSSSFLSFKKPLFSS